MFVHTVTNQDLFESSFQTEQIDDPYQMVSWLAVTLSNKDHLASLCFVAVGRNEPIGVSGGARTP